MPSYMTQKMSSGALKAVTYYRKQSQSHVDHTESGTFTDDAVADYATVNNIQTSKVGKGSFKSGQGIPQGGTTKLI